MCIEFFTLPKKIRKMTEDEAYEEVFVAGIISKNSYNFSMYSITNDRCYLDNIIDVDNLIIPNVKEKIKFHGACHDCELQQISYKNCLTCENYFHRRKSIAH